ncbi:hypothetical protein LZ30DRAFT_312991 [Colletotrichum cereale]|nr:hypothetical protein LZ30DRAFT_312991 [Colletotrichum cereale]
MHHGEPLPPRRRGQGQSSSTPHPRDLGIWGFRNTMTNFGWEEGQRRGGTRNGRGHGKTVLRTARVSLRHTSMHQGARDRLVFLPDGGRRGGWVASFTAQCNSSQPSSAREPAGFHFFLPGTVVIVVRAPSSFLEHRRVRGRRRCACPPSPSCAVQTQM